MRKLILSFLLLASVSLADIIPDMFTFTWNRTDVSAAGDTNTWLSGVTYLLTNNIVMSSTTTQDLTGLGIEIRAGNNIINSLFTGTVVNADNGTFSCLFSFPSPNATTAQGMPVYLQLSITNGTGTRVTYKGQKRFVIVNPLH